MQVHTIPSSAILMCVILLTLREVITQGLTTGISLVSPRFRLIGIQGVAMIESNPVCVVVIIFFSFVFYIQNILFIFLHHESHVK